MKITWRSKSVPHEQSLSDSNNGKHGLENVLTMVHKKGRTAKTIENA